MVPSFPNVTIYWQDKESQRMRIQSQRDASFSAVIIYWCMEVKFSNALPLAVLG